MAAPGGRRPGAGRKKGVPNRVNRELAEALRQYTPAASAALVKAMGRMVRIVGKRDDRLAIAAASTLNQILGTFYDRAHGKAVQAIRHSGFIGDLTKLTDEEIAFLERIGERLATPGADPGGAPPPGAPPGTGIH
jgi:hypothetical protein